MKRVNCRIMNCETYVAMKILVKQGFAVVVKCCMF
jgi:hypothetical protein